MCVWVCVRVCVRACMHACVCIQKRSLKIQSHFVIATHTVRLGGTEKGNKEVRKR